MSNEFGEAFPSPVDERKKIDPQRYIESVKTSVRSLEARLNPQKLAERRDYFGRFPHRHLFVPVEHLQGIIDYDAFKCSPYSSVVRGEAIKGSDIDGGLVILRESVDVETQMRFIQFLRNWGFTVYHESEVKKMETRLRKMGHKNPGENGYEAYQKLLEKCSHAPGQIISFYTRDELEAKVEAQDWDSPTSMYIAGVDVPRD